MSSELNRGHRSQLRKDGYTLNIAEFEAAGLLKKNGCEYDRRGYPDFLVLKENEIVGFIEVKPRRAKPLKSEQQRFERFCARHSIPFMKWTPEDGEDAITAFTAAL